MCLPKSTCARFAASCICRKRILHEPWGFTIDQIKAWEQNRNRPLGGVRAYLMIIDLAPEAVIEILRTKVRHAVNAKRPAVTGPRYEKGPALSRAMSRNLNSQ